MVKTGAKYNCHKCVVKELPRSCIEVIGSWDEPLGSWERVVQNAIWKFRIRRRSRNEVSTLSQCGVNNLSLTRFRNT